MDSVEFVADIGRVGQSHAGRVSLDHIRSFVWRRRRVRRRPVQGSQRVRPMMPDQDRLADGAVVSPAGRPVDADGTDAPRFPLGNVPLVRQRLAALLARERAVAVVCSAACGADLVAVDGDGSERCSNSSRPAPHHASCRATPLFTTSSTFGVIWFPAVRCASSGRRRRRSGVRRWRPSDANPDCTARGLRDTGLQPMRRGPRLKAGPAGRRRVAGTRGARSARSRCRCRGT